MKTFKINIEKMLCHNNYTLYNILVRRRGTGSNLIGSSTFLSYLVLKKFTNLIICILNIKNHMSYISFVTYLLSMSVVIYKL